MPPEGAERERRDLCAEASFMFREDVALYIPRACIFAIIRCPRIQPRDILFAHARLRNAPRGYYTAVGLKVDEEGTGRKSWKTPPPDGEVTAKRKTGPIVTIEGATR